MSALHGPAPDASAGHQSYVVVGVGIVVDPRFTSAHQWINTYCKSDLVPAVQRHFEASEKLASGFVQNIRSKRTPPPDLVHCGQFVIPVFPDECELTMPTSAGAADNTKTHAATESCAYHKYRSGHDALGFWSFDPLGAAVKDIFVAVAQRGGSGDTGLDMDDVCIQVADVRASPQGPIDDAAQRIALHHLLRFVHHHNNSGNKNASQPVPWLDRNVVDNTLRSLVHLIDNKVNFQVVESIFRRLTFKEVAAPRGLLVWGPPGTGKTVFSQRVAEATGLVPVREGKGFAAGELRHGLQGGSERNVAAMLLRANACPWLMFSVVIDEIESLVPKRGGGDGANSAASSEKSALGVMLTYFGGLKDVPNIFVFGLTNHRTSLDAAFMRRMTGKLFLGVPSPVTRMTWNTSGRFHIAMKLRRLMADLTVNFSGANMKELMDELHMKCLHESQSANHVTEAMLRETVQVVSKSERVLISGMTPVELEYRNKVASARYQSIADDDFDCIAKLIASRADQWTGRMFVSLSAPPRATNAFEGPYVDLQRNNGTVHTLRCQWACAKAAANATATTRTVADRMLNMVPRYMLSKDNVRMLLMNMSQRLNASFVRIVDAAHFYSDRCSDEASMMHELAEIMGQCREYDRCIVALDMDTVVLSPAFDANQLQFPSLLHQILSIAEDASRMSEDLSSFLIVVVVSSSESCTQRFKDKLGWPENEACDFALQKSFNLDLAETLPSLSDVACHHTLRSKQTLPREAVPVWCNACGVPVDAHSDSPPVANRSAQQGEASSSSVPSSPPSVACRACIDCDAFVPAIASHNSSNHSGVCCPSCVGEKTTRRAMAALADGSELDKQVLFLWWRETAFDDLTLQCSESQSAVLEAAYQVLLSDAGRCDGGGTNGLSSADSACDTAEAPSPVLPWAMCPAGTPLLVFPPHHCWEHHNGDGYLRFVARGCKSRPDEVYRRYELATGAKLGHCYTATCTSQEPQHFREHVHSLLLQE